MTGLTDRGRSWAQDRPVLVRSARLARAVAAAPGLVGDVGARLAELEREVQRLRALHAVLETQVVELQDELADLRQPGEAGS